MSKKEIYTAHDVDDLIPQLENIFQHIEVCKSRAEALAAKAMKTPGKSETKDLVQIQLIRSQVEFLMEAVQDDINQIFSLGGVAKDLDAGLVDFPGEVEGRDVWLCWKRGESRVRFWHALEEGFSQRQALPQRENNTLH